MTGFTEAAKQFLLAHRRRSVGHSRCHGADLVRARHADRFNFDHFAHGADLRADRRALGFDPLAFAIIGILAIETGLLTPPFGILVFTVKAAVPDKSVTLSEIFRGSIPYWIVLLGIVVLLAAFPKLATFLPSL